MTAGSFKSFPTSCWVRNWTDLLDSDADPDRVDGALDQDLLLLITTDDYRLEEQLFTAPEQEKTKGLYSALQSLSIIGQTK